MKLKPLGTIFLVLATLLFAGCRSAPVDNVSDAAFTSTEQGVTQQDVARAIETAGRSLGWIMKEKEPGNTAALHGCQLIRARLFLLRVRRDQIDPV